VTLPELSCRELAASFAVHRIFRPDCVIPADLGGHRDPLRDLDVPILRVASARILIPGAFRLLAQEWRSRDSRTKSTMSTNC
jgi:hypothetical protein